MTLVLSPSEPLVPVEAGPRIPFALSKSAHETAKDCLMKWWLQYIANEKGVDSSPRSRAFGSAVHKVLEVTKAIAPKDFNDFAGSVTQACNAVAQEYQIQGTPYEFDATDEAQVYTHTRAIMEYIASTPFKIIATEFKIKNQEPDEKWFTGVVDALEVSPDGFWFINDYKTATEILPLAELEHDLQMRVYEYMAPIIAKMFGLSMDKFGGGFYTTVIKKTHKPAANETWEDFYNRPPKGNHRATKPEVVRYWLPPNKEVAEAVAMAHKTLWKTLWSKVPEGVTAFRKNTRACKGKYGKCKFWGTCHGTANEVEVSAQVEPQAYSDGAKLWEGVANSLKYFSTLPKGECSWDLTDAESSAIALVNELNENVSTTEVVEEW